MRLDRADIYHLLTEKRSVFMQRLEALGTLEDPDSVHDLRVATRRLREVFRLLAVLSPDSDARRLLKQVGNFARRLSRLRELDVSMSLLSGLRLELPAHDPYAAWGLVAMEHHINISRHELKEELAPRMVGGRMRRLVHRLASFTPDLTDTTQEQTLEALRGQVSRHAEESLELLRALRAKVPSPERLHRLRITLKKLRYAFELLDSGEGSPLPLLLKQIQEALGLHRDWMLLEEQTYGYYHRLHESGSSRDVRLGLRMLRHQLEARVLAHLAEARALATPLREQCLLVIADNRS